ncbi:MAG: 3-keto-5-aminohexanoate cleavage protein, partial [Sphingomonas fennica]
MASLNMGSINFNLSELADKERDWKFAWEQKFLRSTSGLIFQNTFDDIEWIITEIGIKGGTRFEFECYDISHLYTLDYFVGRGLLKPPFFIQSVF